MLIRSSSKLFIICLLYIGICANGYGEEVYIYDSRGRRDPFMPLVKHILPTEPRRARGIESLADIEFIEDVKLQGVASDSTGKKIAILNGEMMEEGEAIGHLKLKKISKNGIILVIGESEHKLSIYTLEEGG